MAAKVDLQEQGLHCMGRPRTGGDAHSGLAIPTYMMWAGLGELHDTECHGHGKVPTAQLWAPRWMMTFAVAVRDANYDLPSAFRQLASDEQAQRELSTLHALSSGMGKPIAWVENYMRTYRVGKRSR